MKIWFILHNTFVVISAIALDLNGFSIDSWVWWIVILTSTFSYNCGREYEAGKKGE